MKRILITLFLSFLLISWVWAYAWWNTQINQSLFFDWKKIGPYNEISNLHKLWDDWHQYTYSKWVNKYYININWKDFWPYDYVWLAKSFNNWYVYYYRLLNLNDTDEYISVNWKTYWPFKKYSDLYEIWNDWYYIKYFIWGKTYINSNWKEYGPYDNADIDWYNFDKNNKFSFHYTKNNQKYINIEWEEYWPYEIEPEASNWNFRYIKNEKAFININWKEYGPYDKWDGYVNLWPKFLGFNSNNNIGFSYLINDKYYLNINWKEYGPYDTVFYDTEKYEWEWFSFRYIDDNKYYINQNDKVYGPFDNISNLWLLLKDFYSYTYLKEWVESECSRYMRGICIHEIKKQYLYVNINWTEYGPYEYKNIKIKRLGFNSYYYEYFKSNKGYVNINGKEYWPYLSLNNDYVDNWYIVLNISDTNTQIINEKGLYKTINNDNIYFHILRNTLEVYSYKIWDEEYININWKDYLYYNSYFNKKLLNKWYIYSYNKDWKNYINVDWKEYGPYDKTISNENLIVLNNFYWFTYKIDWKSYVNINSKEYWPYDEETYIRLKSIWNDWVSYETVKWVWTSLQIINKYYIENKIFNTDKIKSNPQINRLLNKIFIKIDKKWETKAKLVYQSLIKRIDTLINKAKTEKNKELLNYIKNKVLEKIKLK